MMILRLSQVSNRVAKVVKTFDAHQRPKLSTVCRSSFGLGIVTRHVSEEAAVCHVFRRFILTYVSGFHQVDKPSTSFASTYRFVIRSLALPVLLIFLATQLSAFAQEAKPKISAGLIKAADASPTRLKELKSKRLNTVVIKLESPDNESKKAVRLATTSAKDAGLSFGYWVEVARAPKLADKHPEWMASLQTHDQWRRFFPNAKKPTANEVAKTYPWVPILSRKPFQAQRQRVVALLADLPQAELIFLNDLQGAPSACGCGNSLCRWTSDYGNKRTTVPLGDDAAALFVEAIEKASPRSEVVPVWATECEEHDGDPDGLCAGVGCFNGICWKAYTRQLTPVAVTSDRIAVLATYKQFQRDVARYGEAEASWVGFALNTFKTMPPKHAGKAVPASRLIAVLQGWDVTPKEIAAQQSVAEKAGANGYVVAFDKIEQSWSPKVVPWK